jgi:hypothetical protein
MSVAHRSQTYLTPTQANFMILAFTAVFGFIGLEYVGAVLGYLIPRKARQTWTTTLPFPAELSQ